MSLLAAVHTEPQPACRQSVMRSDSELAQGDDQILLEAIAQGDKAAFTQFLERYLTAIVEFAQRYLGSRAEAEDIAQEAFIRVWRKAASWHPQGAPPRSWLYRIAKNLCVDELRKRRKQTSLDENDELPATECTPERSMEQDDQAAAINKAFAMLPERQRTAIILCAQQGLSNKEAAIVMGVSIDALESLLSRGRRKLREILRPVREGMSI